MTTINRGVYCDPEDDPMDIYTENKEIQTRALVEVFSIRFIGMEKSSHQQTHGVILLKGSGKRYVIFEDRGDGEPSCFNSEGYFTLIDPECIVEVKDKLVIYPWLFNSLYCDNNKGVTLWERSLSSPRTNQLIRKGFETPLGIMKVNFAVYSDGVVAKLEVALCNLELSRLLERGKPVKIYGTIKAYNDVVTHSEATSILFDHITRQECITLGPESFDSANIQLPLSKSTTAIPRNSVLFIDFSLYLRYAPRDICIINRCAVFQTRPGGSSAIDLLGNYGTIQLKASWSE